MWLKAKDHMSSPGLDNLIVNWVENNSILAIKSDSAAQ